MSYLKTARASLEAARRRQSESSGETTALGEAKVNKKQLNGMSLDQFAQAGLIVTVYSEVLEQYVLFVSDNVSEAALANRTLPIYRADELRKLAKFGPSPTALKTIHTLKEVFKGRIADVKTEEDP